MIVEGTVNATIRPGEPSHRADYEQKIAAAKRTLIEAAGILDDAHGLAMGGDKPRGQGGHNETVAYDIVELLSATAANIRGMAGLCNELSGAEWRPLLKAAEVQRCGVCSNPAPSHAPGMFYCARCSRDYCERCRSRLDGICQDCIWDGGPDLICRR